MWPSHSMQEKEKKNEKNKKIYPVQKNKTMNK